MQVPSDGMNATNLIFWNGAASDAVTGAFRGNAANSIWLRSVDENGSPESNTVTSVVIYTEAYGAAIATWMHLGHVAPQSIPMEGPDMARLGGLAARRPAVMMGDACCCWAADGRMYACAVGCS